MRRSILALLIPFSLASCSTIPAAKSEYVRASVKALHDHPERWAGRKVEVSGIAVREFENYGLYAPVEDLCAERPVAIYVDWYEQHLPGWPTRMRRPGTFRGVFTNEVGVQPGGVFVINTAAAGPGPLKNVQLVRWTGPELQRCR